ncbi:GNAT family N-acetyltransferase [Bacillus sp. 2205SS5-2]|uniref:GNAT family N-acetyltransferase n=1 Tax=Bacillus sp. 2205SS5-2 TaxID=3109031 RepID=UPI003FA54B26
MNGENNIKLKRATKADLPILVDLFDQYRVWYKQTSDKIGARQYLSDRIEKKESVIFLVVENEIGLGFTQLFPSFSSVTMQQLWILNDLFIREETRGRGVGSMLIQQAKEYSIETNAKGIILETDDDNFQAQQLYDRTGFKRDTAFRYYFYH